MSTSRWLHQSLCGALALNTCSSSAAIAQRALGEAVRSAVALDAPEFVLQHARVIDGTGAPPRQDQTIVVKQGRIYAYGPAARVEAPAGAKVIDLAGKTVIPGLVMLHEHLFYPRSASSYAPLAVSFARLLLAGGVTTARTAGGVAVTEDLNVARLIRLGQLPGPDLFVTGAILAGVALQFPQVPVIRDSTDVLRQVDFWSREGASSVKVYTGLGGANIRAAASAAHLRGVRVLGHLCAVTFTEAAALGVDHIEHGFLTATDFVPSKPKDVCPATDVVLSSFLSVSVDDPRVAALFRTLIEHGIGITSTLPVFETYARDSLDGLRDGLMLLVPEWQARFNVAHAQMRKAVGVLGEQVLRHEMEFERAFVRAGGKLTVGTDPTGIGGVVPPAANARSLELLVEAGFSPTEVLRMATLGGAQELGVAEQVGSIAVGKRADLVVLRGDPTVDITAVRRVEMVIKDGIGFDPGRLVAPLRGKVGAP